MKKRFACLLVVAVAAIGFLHFRALRLYAQSTTSTRIFVPYVESQVSYTQFLSIANTGMDPYGTLNGSSGDCTADLYVGGTHFGPKSIGTFAPGTDSLVSLATICSDVSDAGCSDANNDRAYLFLTCAFPYAHVQNLLVNPSGDVVYYPAYVVPPNRSYSTGPEQLLQ